MSIVVIEPSSVLEEEQLESLALIPLGCGLLYCCLRELQVVLLQVQLSMCSSGLVEVSSVYSVLAADSGSADFGELGEGLVVCY